MEHFHLKCPGCSVRYRVSLHRDGFFTFDSPDHENDPRHMGKGAAVDDDGGWLQRVDLIPAKKP